MMLNGPWEFEITKKRGLPTFFSREILVPFAVETSLSGVHKEVAADDILHYRKTFKKEKSPTERAVLHFDGVDQICDVFFNGRKIGRHIGGYLPFAYDVTEIYQEENEIYLEVTDDVQNDVLPRGKQSKHPGGIWYTSTSGVYQSVWLEIVPEDYISSFRMTPNVNEGKLHLSFSTFGDPYPMQIVARRKGHVVAHALLLQGNEIDLVLPKPLDLWSPEDPNLYDLEIYAKEDYITSYFAMREYGTIDYQGHKVFALNGKPYFLSGVLDQGYVPESGLTYPSVEAMEFDLKLLKEYGFNMVRKHIKLEPMLWYSVADRLGLIVFQDFVNGGGKYNTFLFATGTFFQPKRRDDKPSFIQSVGRENPVSRAFFEQTMDPFVCHLYNVPSIASYVLFNEAWGQFESKRLEQKLRALDPTRLVDAVSGWCDQGGGDFDSHHIYFRKVHLKPSKSRILFLSEFGGYSLHLKEHSWSKKVFGYKRFKNKDKLNKALKKLYEEQLIPLRDKAGLAALVYTQLSDVEEETNGLVTYDRKVKKADPELFRALNEELKFHD